MERNKNFYLALHGTSLFVPYRREEEGSLSLKLLSSGTGESFLPAFFSTASKTGDFAGGEFVELNFSDLRNMFIELDASIKGLVIEPFEKNIIIRREDFLTYDSLTKGMTVQRKDHTGLTELRPAGNLPKGLRECLVEFCAAQIGINAMWGFCVKGEKERIPHLMFSVDFYGSKFDLFPKLAEVIKPFMKPGESFELIERNPNLELNKIASAQIYRRGAGITKKES